MIDSHAHIYDETFKDDIELVIQRAKDAGISKILMPAIDSSVIDPMLSMESLYPNYCIPMMGLHPCYVKENYAAELEIVKQWLEKRKFTAIGEIGLDYYWDTTFVAEQKIAFETQMQWALDYDLPIAIHTRNAMGETIEMVKPFAKKGLKGVFHCFSGSNESAKEIIKMGFYLGIGGVVTYKNAGVAEALIDIPLDSLMLETDAPYLPPVPYRGKRNEPIFMKEVAQKIADIKQVDIQLVIEKTVVNTETLFKSII
jgi:TatD DNase family protein